MHDGSNCFFGFFKRNLSYNTVITVFSIYFGASSLYPILKGGKELVQSLRGAAVVGGGGKFGHFFTERTGLSCM